MAANKGQFVKGQSGNPGGRPRTADALRELIGEKTAARIVQARVSIAINDTTLQQRLFGKPLRVTTRDMAQAQEYLLDQYYGKAIQTVSAGEGAMVPMLIMPGDCWPLVMAPKPEVKEP